MPRTGKFFAPLLAFLIIGIAGATEARADIVFIQGTTSAAQQNIQFNSTGLVSSGNPVTGSTNQTNTIFVFGSNEALVTPSAGAARIEAADGTFTTLSIQPQAAGVFFNELDFNLIIAGQGNSTNGFVSFTVTENNGQVTTSQQFAVSSAGQNNFSVTAINGQLIRTVVINSTVGIADIRQIQVGGITTQQTPVPEPATMLLLGTGLAGVGAAVRRRRKSVSSEE